MPSVPRPNELTHLDDSELKRLAVMWRVRAGRGQREAFGIAPRTGSRAAPPNAGQPVAASDTASQARAQVVADLEARASAGRRRNGYGVGRLQ